MRFSSVGYTQLHVFAQPVKNLSGKAVLLNAQGELMASEEIKGYGTWIRFSIHEGEHQLEVEDAKVALAYLCGNQNPYENGVAFLTAQGETLYGDSLFAYFDEINREQYHFTPFCGWMNDPNGLCRYQGYYHLYYQFNPYGQEWNNMYWGHAASADLMHWKHLPVVLEPQKEILEDLRKKGGAFSGSAVPMKDKIRFYLTRHAALGDDVTEYQTMAESADGLTLEGEKTIFPVQGAPIGADCRDPKVEYNDGKWSMVLGSTWQGTPAVLRCTSVNGEDWTLEDPLLQDAEEGIATIECPDLFALDGQYVVVAALMKHRDLEGRLQGTRYYVGSLKDEFCEESRGLYDFGSNFYAVQSFLDKNRRIAIGWISDFYEEHIPRDGGAYGSMSLPRELSIRNGKLWMRPVQEVLCLRGRQLYSGAGENVVLEHTSENAYMMQLKLKSTGDFDLVLAQNEKASLSLRCKDGLTEIVTQGVASAAVRFPADVKETTFVEIFMDRRVCEVFLNEGEAAGTKLFYSGKGTGVFCATFADPSNVEKLEVYAMNSCWKP